MSSNADHSPLRHIINKSSVTPVFQAIVDCASAKILGFEALTRGPAGSPLFSPEHLFQQAKAEQCLPELEILCRQQSLLAHARQQLPGLVFINVSPIALLSPGYPRGVTSKLLEELGIPCSRVVIELSEKYPFPNLSQILDSLNAYRELGFKIAMDDLGSGYSDLKMWAELKPDFVKIDRFFIHEVDRSATKREFVQGICRLAEGLGSGVIAEGIENEEQLDTIRQLGIRYCQGYFFNKPEHAPNSALIAEKLASLSNITSGTHYDKSAYSLCSHVEPVAPSSSLLQVWERFTLTQAYSSLPVVDRENVVGIVHKSHILELFSGQYGRALYAKKPVSEISRNNAIVVDKNTRLEEISELITNEDDMYIRQHFIITDNDHYIGMGVTRDLLRKITEIKLQSARYANPLTLLPGNVPIIEKIAELLSQGTQFYIAYFDINHFKPYNDVYGYRKGDQIIQSLGQILTERCHQQHHFVGHIGGDDFVVIFIDSDFKEDCAWVLSAFERSLDAFYSEEDTQNGYIEATDRYGTLKQFELLSLSVGVVESHANIRNAEEYGKLSTDAKMNAKKMGRNQVYFESWKPGNKGEPHTATQPPGERHSALS